MHGYQLLQKGITGLQKHWQIASNFQAGALTWIVGSRKGGFTRAFGFRSEGVIFFSVFPFIFSPDLGFPFI